MKVLHICCNLAGSTVFVQLFEALAALGLEQAVAVPEKYASNVGKNVPGGIETKYLMTVKKTDALFFFRKAQRTVPEILKQFDLSGVTLIHAHTLFTDGWIARELSRRTGIPYAVTLRYSDMDAIWKYEPHLHPMGRKILLGAKAVVFLGGPARERVLRGWLNAEQRACVEPGTAIIPNGIDPLWLDGRAKAAPQADFRVGFAGLLNQRKRPQDALKAVHIATTRGIGRFTLMLAGSGPLEETLRNALDEGDTLCGRISGMDAMKAFYRKCDALLVPSEAETFGMVYLEAMSQGVPVLYTRGQGFDGQCPEGTVGYSVPCGDPEAQVEALLRLKDDYAARSERCVRIAADYAWPKVAKKWMALYGRISQ